MAALTGKVAWVTGAGSGIGQAAAIALDRTLLWNHYVVPQWYYDKARTARWDRFGHPDPMPKFGVAAFPTVWWWDVQKAAKAG